MASHAPGNGWFPERSRLSRPGSGVRPRTVPGTTNVYAFPSGTRETPASRRPIRAALASKLMSALLFESMRAGHTARWLAGWCVFALAIASSLWIGLAGLFITGALFIGIPWPTVAVVTALTHALGAVLAVLMARRLGKSLIASMDRRKH